MWQWEEESNWAIAIAWLRHTFPKGLKSAVLAKNFMDNGNAYKSEAKTEDEGNFDPEEGDLQKDNIYNGDAAEITTSSRASTRRAVCAATSRSTMPP